MKSIFSKISSRQLFLLTIIFCTISFHSTFGQENTINQIESNLKNTFGIEKLIALNTLTDYYYQIEHPRKPLRYARQAVVLAENIFMGTKQVMDSTDHIHIEESYFLLGQILYDKNDFYDAKENLEKAKAVSEKSNETKFLNKINNYLSNIQLKINSGEIKENFFSKTFRDLNFSEAFGRASSDMKIQSEIRIGESDAQKGNFQNAINHYEQAINLLRNKGDDAKIRELQLKVAVLLDSMDQHVEAQKILNNAIAEYESTKDTIQNPVVSTGSIQEKEITQANKMLDSMQMEKQNLKTQSENFAREKEFEKSLEYLKKYQDLSKKMVEDSLEVAARQQFNEDEILLLKQQKKIADLNIEAIEKENIRQQKAQKATVFISIFILVVLLIILYFYLSKRRQHKKLSIAYRDLDNTKNKLEGAEKKIVTLLRQQVSGDIARELLSNDMDKPGEERFVCIMFVDIRDFTPMAEKLSPEELISYQNDVFGFMIDVVQKNHGNINQLLGDGFMATFGAPVSRGNDCQNAFVAANQILKELKDRNKAGVIQKTKIGIGLHAGYVVTGNVGNEARKQYSVTGNPVIIASRVEQLNKEYKSKLLITEEVYNKLEKPLKINEPFIEVELKGRSHPVRVLKMA